MTTMEMPFTIYTNMATACTQQGHQDNYTVTLETGAKIKWKNLLGSGRLNQTFQAVDGVQRLKKIQMGCRCCKMIRSYIFDPEEVQSPGCIPEVNSYKHHEQGSKKSKFKENSDIQERKNELQKDELNRTEDKNQVHSAKEPLWNHGGSDFQEDGAVKCVTKHDVAVNGGSSCAGAHPVLSPSTNPVKETSDQGTSSQSAEASVTINRDFYTKSNRPGQELDLEADRWRKAACNEPNSIQGGNSRSAEDSTFLKGSAIAETQNNAIQLPDIDYPQSNNPTGNCVEKDSFSVNCAHSDQNTRPSPIQDQDLCVTLPSPVKESSIGPFKTDSTSSSEGIPGGITAVAVPRVAQAPAHPNHGGQIEEEDAEIAAALAALEAATAGEDLEDEDKY